MGKLDPTRLEKTGENVPFWRIDVHLEKGASKFVGDEACKSSYLLKKCVGGVGRRRNE